MAAADLAAGRSVEPPPDLLLLWDWRDLGTPPIAGGLYDQPGAFLKRARYLEAVYTIFKRFYAHGTGKFNHAEQTIFKQVLELRKQHASLR